MPGQTLEDQQQQKSLEQKLFGKASAGNNMISNCKVLFNFLLGVVVCTLNASCVSVNLDLNQKYPKSKNASYSQPKSPFVKQTTETNLDSLWISQETKSTIGFYSICNKNLPPLRNARSNSLNGIEALQILKEDVIQYNEREGLRSTIQGKLEGFLFQIESVLFIKDSCLFEISYVAYKENYDKEKETFNLFLNSFKVR